MRQKLAKWNKKTKQYEPIDDPYGEFMLALECKYAVSETSHPVRWVSERHTEDK